MSKKKPRQEKKQKWEEVDEKPKGKGNQKPKNKQPVEDDEPEENSQEEQVDQESGEEEETGAHSRAELRKWKKDLKFGRITKEEFDKLRGIKQEQTAQTEDEKKEELAKQAKESAVQEYKQKRGEQDSKARDIRIEGITLSYKGQPLLVETDLIITHGRKYGLIGPNGAGL